MEGFLFPSLLIFIVASNWIQKKIENCISFENGWLDGKKARVQLASFFYCFQFSWSSSHLWVLISSCNVVNIRWRWNIILKRGDTVPCVATNVRHMKKVQYSWHNTWIRLFSLSVEIILSGPRSNPGLSVSGWKILRPTRSEAFLLFFFYDLFHILLFVSIPFPSLPHIAFIPLVHIWKRWAIHFIYLSSIYLSTK